MLLFIVLAAVPACVLSMQDFKERQLYAEPQKPMDPESRIIGGFEAVPHSIPYQVALRIFTPQGQFFCGGSLISSNYVLTAAHCTESAQSVEVVLGSHNLKEIEPTQVRVQCQNILVHPGWDSSRIANDISLIQLPSPVYFNQYIQKIDLAQSSAFAETAAFLSGWGKVTDVGTTSVLHQVTLPVISNQECASYYPSMVQNTNVCTSGFDIKGGCNGDSGGPLVINGQQIGIVSFGARTCTKGFPTVFTRVSEYIDWIKQNSDLGYF